MYVEGHGGKDSGGHHGIRDIRHPGGDRRHGGADHRRDGAPAAVGRVGARDLPTLRDEPATTRSLLPPLWQGDGVKQSGSFVPLLEHGVGQQSRASG